VGVGAPKIQNLVKFTVSYPHRIEMNDATINLKYGMEEHKKGSLLHANIPYQ